MSNELDELRDEYLDAIKLFIWYSPSDHSFFKNKASKPLAAQHRVAAQVAWVRYTEKRKGKQ